MNFKEKRERKAFLALAKGNVFHGYSVGAAENACGEIIFNTSSSQYSEILSDQAYAGKIVVMTTPEIGNCGVSAKDMKSEKFCVAGLIIRELNEPSSWQSEESLQAALIRYNIPAIAGIDTRALTLLLRESNSQKAFMSVNGKIDVNAAIEKAKN